MKAKFFAAVAAATAMCSAGSASAADLLYAHVESFYSLGLGATIGQTLVTGFETTDGSADVSKLIIADGFQFSTGPGASLTTGSVDNLEQAPAAGNPAVQDPTQYLAVHAGGFATLEIDEPVYRISFYVGSFDSFDKMRFFYVPPSNPAWEEGNGTWVNFETLGFDTTVGTNGNIFGGATNGLLTLRFDRPIQAIQFMAGQNAFEVGSISIPVPEPTTWAMMIVGFGGVGAIMRRRRNYLRFA